MDHNATTPLDERVWSTMLPFLREQFGNAASQHAYGWQAQTAVRKAREQVAALCSVKPNQVLWTSGATESNNLAILGLVRAFKNELNERPHLIRPHFITQATEHKAVLEVFEAAALELDAEITVLPVDCEGQIRLSDLEAALTPQTRLISVMMANNEIGTLQPIADIAKICKAHKIIFHCDAAQAAGKMPIDLSELSIDLLSLSGHKMYGPKGVGALIYRPINCDFELKPILFGGDQEKRLRPGTQNIPGIVGLGEACRVAQSEQIAESARMKEFQKYLYNAIMTAFPRAKLNGPLDHRLCNNLSFSFPDLAGDELPLSLSGLAYSAGSACNSASGKPSHVLSAIGLSADLASSTVRLGLGRTTTLEEVREVAKMFQKLSEVCGATKEPRQNLEGF